MFIILLNTASTLIMTGVIWFVQIVHYPLFAKVGAQQFTEYEDLHKRLTTVVVAPLMILELTTCIILVFGNFSQLVTSLVYIGLIITFVLWMTTAFVQVPIHNSLTHSYSASQVDKLVSSNWSRTILWSIRSILTIVIVCLIQAGH